MRFIFCFFLVLSINTSLAIEAIDYPVPDYSLLSTSLEGLPVVLVVNSTLVHFEPKDKFPWHLSIIIDVQDLAERGMPTSKESELLTTLSEQMDYELTKDGNALFFVRQTWNGHKQLLFRVMDPKLTDTTLKSLLSTHNIREWEYRMDHDGDWNLAKIYFDVLAGATKQ